MILISIFCSSISNRLEILSTSILSGAQDAITLVFSMVGMMALWSGLMKIAEFSGITCLFSKFLSPVLKILFPDYYKNKKASNAICMNIIANFLGLGNSATPLGIIAMKEMNKTNKNYPSVNKSIAMFLVLNTASFQLIPTFLSSLLQKHGSSNPFRILPALWVVSIVSLSTGLFACKIFSKVCKE